MLSLRLIRLIAEHSEDLARDLVDRLRHSSRTVDYFKIPEHELLQYGASIYRNLEEWLLNKTETDVEYQYTQIGMKRAEAGIAISDFIWALVITKENLWRFLQVHAAVDRMAELYGELEFMQLVDQFFDRAMYYAAVGYQRVKRKLPEAA
jgi:hypothetical protein